MTQPTAKCRQSSLNISLVWLHNLVIGFFQLFSFSSKIRTMRLVDHRVVRVQAEFCWESWASQTVRYGQLCNSLPGCYLRSVNFKNLVSSANRLSMIS